MTSAKKYTHTRPPMPNSSSLYTEAKAAEYDGNIEMAVKLYKLCISTGDHVDSSVKDLAGVLHMNGRTSEAVVLLENSEELISDEKRDSYENLTRQLRVCLQDAKRRDFDINPHWLRLLIFSDVCIFGTGETSLEIISNAISGYFPNFSRIKFILYVGYDAENKCYIFFVKLASLSSIRKAVHVNRNSASCSMDACGLYRVHPGTMELFDGDYSDYAWLVNVHAKYISSHALDEFALLQSSDTTVFTLLFADEYVSIAVCCPYFIQKVLYQVFIYSSGLEKPRCNIFGDKRKNGLTSSLVSTACPTPTLLN